MEVIFQICAFALVCLVLLVFLGQHSPQSGVVVSLAACVGILLVLTPQLYQQIGRAHV